MGDVKGILVPGGFGNRGIEGKILAINYARVHKIPFLGLCLGMQLAIVEVARNMVEYTDAHSAELDPNTTYPVIHLMPEQDGRIVEMMEIPDHPWFVATQAHPEFKSRPNRPHPLFRGFVEATLEN